MVNLANLFPLLPLPLSVGPVCFLIGNWSVERGGREGGCVRTRGGAEREREREKERDRHA